MRGLAHVVVVTVTMTLLLSRSSLAQTTAGSVSGSVVDTQGGAIPGAVVSLTNVTRGDTQTVHTDAVGLFVFPQVQPATYVLRVALDGFKPYELAELVVNANDKKSAGVVKLEVGALAEAVFVSGRLVELQTASAERSYALEGKVLQDVAVNSRSYLALVGLAPGVVSTANLTVAGHAGLGAISANGARSNTNNLTLDGIGNVDTGNNGDQLATLSLDAVAEFKMLTANYQAEYGRSSGAQISVVTKSGGRDFHGSGYFYRRNDSWNAKSWMNNREGQPINVLQLKDAGYTLGGPAFKFTDDNRVFFFVGQEFQRQLRPQTIRRVTMPTALERKGNFSQTVDNNGSPFPYIRDWTTGLPCSASNTSGCFQSGGVLGVIPPERLYGPGLAILNMLPLPNAPGNRGFNYTSQISDNYPRREDIYRIDWTPRADWRIFGRYVNNFDSVTSNYGSFVLGANFPLVAITDTRPGRALALSATKVITPTLFNEMTGGFGYNRINIDPVDSGLTRTAAGIASLPALYPGAIQQDFIPRFTWGTRVGANPTSVNGNAPIFGTNNAPFFNFNRTVDLIDNMTKIIKEHTVKVGIYFQRSFKDQTSFANANGDINFGDSSTNPFDTGFGYANAATGIFTSYNQASQYVTGRYRYNNIEWYAQDNWKVNARLTLDYGMRFYWIQPQYDAARQTSTFLSDRWDPKKAPRLFLPTFSITGARIGYDPVTGQTVSSLDIGKIVPGSGDLLNGILKAGEGIPAGLMKTRGVLPAPRFGITYDLSGTQRFIVRGGGGVFYDRFQGNETFDMITNPPTTFAPTLQNGRLQDVDPRNALLAPSSLNAFDFEGKIPTVYNFNAGVQVKLPAAFVADVSYVGSKGRHLLERRNLNAIPYGAAYLPQNQDPTKAAANPNAVVGTNALDADFLRPYRGYRDITLHEMNGRSTYNSLQMSLDRRFINGLLFGVSYTLSKALGTADADGSFHRIDQFNDQANYGPLNIDRRHNFVLNFVYELPGMPARLRKNDVVRALFDKWQISGLYRLTTGAPYTPGFSIPGIGNVQLTGSNTEGARIVVVGDTNGTLADPYRQLNAAAFTIPKPGSIGLESGRNFMYGPGINSLDVSVQKTVPLAHRTRLELRADAFNVLNRTQFSGVNSTLNVRSLADPTPLNLPFDAQGNFIFANRNGFGTISGVRDPRIVQLVARLQF